MRYSNFLDEIFSDNNLWDYYQNNLNYKSKDIFNSDDGFEFITNYFKNAGKEMLWGILKK